MMYVRSKMTINPYTVSPSQSVIDAQELIAKHGVKRLPVVKNGKLVGLVTSRDISRYSPSKATSLSMGEISYLLAKTKISSIMTKDPITISPDSLLEEAATLMRDNDIGCLPVVEGDKVVGIITESNLLDAFIELLGFKEPGTRLTVEAVDAPGILSKLTGIYGEHDANITHVAVYRGKNGKSDIVIGTNSLETQGIEKSLELGGYKVVYKLQNK
ncbi:MAG: CBS domain-containing protein [Eubacteriales bacterium]|jgi:acetoin utilization protein AcuB